MYNYKNLNIIKSLNRLRLQKQKSTTSTRKAGKQRTTTTK